MNGSNLTAACIHILLALSDGEKHGYGILLEVVKNTSGETRLGPGTLYGNLKRLLEIGWIRESETSADGDDPRRRYYQLTGDGGVALDQELRRLSVVVKIGTAKGRLNVAGQS